MIAKRIAILAADLGSMALNTYYVNPLNKLLGWLGVKIPQICLRKIIEPDSCGAGQVGIEDILGCSPSLSTIAYQRYAQYKRSCAHTTTDVFTRCAFQVLLCKTGGDLPFGGRHLRQLSVSFQGSRHGRADAAVRGHRRGLVHGGRPDVPGCVRFVGQHGRRPRRGCGQGDLRRQPVAVDGTGQGTKTPDIL